jgi:hypothetical protein
MAKEPDKATQKAIGYCHIPLGKATLLRSMLASLIGQDETKGERRGRK